MRIDAHVHAYPPEIAADPAAWARRTGEGYWGRLVTAGGARNRQGWATLPETRQALRAAGLEAAVLQGWYWENLETCAAQNEWHRAWRESAPDTFLPFAALQPAAGREALTLAQVAWAEGFRGIGELHPGVQGFSLREGPFLEICAWAEAVGCPINLHVTEPAGHDYPGRVATPLEDYLGLAARFPRLRLILAHWGGGLPFYELNPRVRRLLANVVYDTAASSLLYDARVWTRAAALAGPDRLLFGSDFPLRLRGAGSPQIASLAEEARSSGLSPEDLTALFGGNACRVLSLPR